MPDLILLIIVLIMSAIVHEVSHGLAALWLGDPTAKYAGRLTLNPLKPSGSLRIFSHAAAFLLWSPAADFSSRRPSPCRTIRTICATKNTGRRSSERRDRLSNIAIALVFGIFLRIFMVSGLVPTGDVVALIGNIFSGESLLGSGLSAIAIIFIMIIYINILLAFFNLIPIPAPRRFKTFVCYSSDAAKKQNCDWNRDGFIFLLPVHNSFVRADICDHSLYRVGIFQIGAGNIRYFKLQISKFKMTM